MHSRLKTGPWLRHALDALRRGGWHHDLRSCIITGGLVEDCLDMVITVQMLEGDLDLDCDVDVADDQQIALRYGAVYGNLAYDPFYDLDPWNKDMDIDIKDVHRVFARNGSTCQNPIPPQPPEQAAPNGPNP